MKLREEENRQKKNHSFSIAFDPEKKNKSKKIILPLLHLKLNSPIIDKVA